MPFQHPEDRAFVSVELAGTFGHLAGPVFFDVEPLGYRAFSAGDKSIPRSEPSTTDGFNPWQMSFADQRRVPTKMIGA